MLTLLVLNGYPGVGKLSVGKELCKLLPKARLLSNHQLIDTAAALYERHETEFRSLRKDLRQAIFRSLAGRGGDDNRYIIFTEQQSSSPGGTAVMQEYLDASRQLGARLVSVILECSAEENEKRLVGRSANQAATSTKLLDPEILRQIRQNEDIYVFGDAAKLEMKWDVSEMSAADTAKGIVQGMELNNGGGAVASPAEIFPPIRFLDIPGFKHIFLSHLTSLPIHGRFTDLLCWVESRPRRHPNIIFLKLGDSSASLNFAFVYSQNNDTIWGKTKKLLPESAVKITGAVSSRLKDGGDTREYVIEAIEIVAAATIALPISARTPKSDILTSERMDLSLSKRHIYIRSPLLRDIGCIRSDLFYALRVWFETNGFIDFSAPLITPSILYDPSSAIILDPKSTRSTGQLFLSQCAGFYLEAGAQAHERVYNLGPSFRNESRTNRHLMEYWHIKAEIASGNLDGIMICVEVLLNDMIDTLRPKLLPLKGSYPRCILDRFPRPFRRITHAEAIARLRADGFDVFDTANINKAHEMHLTAHYNQQPLWIYHKPEILEPFPYALVPSNPDLTETADLIAPNGFEEICGVAEKIADLEELDNRLIEKGKADRMKEYGWVREGRQVGMVTHTAFGMGFERLLRWVVGVEHVKDTIPFPRVFGRHPLP